MKHKKIDFFSEIDDRKRCIDALRSVLKKENISEYRYSIGGYSEEAVCIEQDGPLWIVYDGERGRKCNLSSFNRLVDGCAEILRRIFVNEDKYNEELNNFYIKAGFVCDYRAGMLLHTGVKVQQPKTKTFIQYQIETSPLYLVQPYKPLKGPKIKARFMKKRRKDIKDPKE